MQGVGNVKLFLSTVNQRLKDTFVQNWSSRLSDSTELPTYENKKRLIEHCQELLNRLAPTNPSEISHRYMRSGNQVLRSTKEEITRYKELGIKKSKRVEKGSLIKLPKKGDISSFFN
ncbi:hypothetical protein DPMN_001593 [Dreissena polymorpha]|uniref:Uncharacterized protein n=1 Tax=Dreissena polymorpha TaxID=45954 RepID=A0A9D4MHJ8_DREPO|nr:hypothetical protein DPMN_001593 [Dreissena polymorpha]